MPLSASDEIFLDRLYKERLRDRPLDPDSELDSELYEPMFAPLGLDDPADRLRAEIRRAGDESMRLFSGFSGSGKTTQLYRLRRDLEARGYFVLYVDSGRYLNTAEPLEVSELLMVLAGSFGEALQDQLGVDLASESYWDRVWSFLNSEVVVKDAGVKVEGSVFGFRSAADIKFALKTPNSFRSELRKALMNRIKELKANVDAFFERGVTQIKKKMGEDTQIVFLFDQLEQLRGTSDTGAAVINSVERIFGSYIELLEIPYVHMVYTVPPWLKFMLPGTVQIELLSTPHLWLNKPDRPDCVEALDVFRHLVRRRLGEDGLRRLFGVGAAQTDAVDELIKKSGGHVRDLLLLLREAVLRADLSGTLPLPPEAIRKAINTVRQDFTSISQEDAKWLDEIGRVRKTGLKTLDPVAVHRLARYFDNHHALYFKNDEEWFDIHPMIRKEVEDVLAAMAASPR